MKTRNLALLVIMVVMTFGSNPVTIAQPETPTLVWQVPLGEFPQDLNITPSMISLVQGWRPFTTAGDRFFANAPGGGIQAFDLLLGDQLWSSPTSGLILAADETNVYVLVASQRIDALDAATGAYKWRALMDGVIGIRSSGSAVHFQTQGELTSGQAGNYYPTWVHTVDKETGELLWAQEGVLSDVVLDEVVVLHQPAFRFSSEYGYWIAGIDSRTGQPLWHFGGEQGASWSPNGGPFVKCGDTILFPLYEELARVNAQSGEVQWSTSVPGPVLCTDMGENSLSPVDFPIEVDRLNDGVFAMTGGQVGWQPDPTATLYLLDRDTGQTRWDFNLATPTTALLISDELIVVSYAEYGLTQAWDPSSNELMWENPNTTYYRFSGAVNGTIVGVTNNFRDEENHVYVGLDSSTGTELWRKEIRLGEDGELLEPIAGYLIYGDPDKGELVVLDAGSGAEAGAIGGVGWEVDDSVVDATGLLLTISSGYQAGGAGTLSAIRIGPSALTNAFGSPAVSPASTSIPLVSSSVAEEQGALECPPESMVQLAQLGRGEPFDIAWSPLGNILAVATTARLELVNPVTGEASISIEAFGPSGRFAWSPDGTRIALSGWDGVPKVWIHDATDGSRLLMLAGNYSSLINSIAWSPDGSKLATSDYDGAVRIWNSATGEPLEDEGVGGLIAWSPDGTRLAVSSRDQPVRVWDASGAWSEMNPSNRLWYREPWSPDGTKLITIEDSTRVNIVDSLTESIVLTIPASLEELRDIQWAPDGGKVALHLSNGAVRILSVEDGENTDLSDAQQGRLTALVWSPDGTRLATGGLDGSVRIWDAASGVELSTLVGHDRLVLKLKWSPDGHHLASLGLDLAIRLWDAESEQQSVELDGYTTWVQSVAWSPEGRFLASTGGSVGSYGIIWIWDGVNGDLIRTIDGISDVVRDARWSPDGARFASVGDDQTLRIWDTASWTQLAALSGHSAPIRSVAWSPDGTRLATGGWDDLVRVWDTVREEVETLFEGHTGGVGTVAWSSDGLHLASGSDDETVRVWSTGREAPTLTLTEHFYWVESVAWSPDARRVASASRDGTLRIWDIVTGETRTIFNQNGRFVFSVDWSPDGQYLASGGPDGILRVWDALSGAIVAELAGSQIGVEAVAWSPDGERIASSEDGTVSVWGCLP